MPPAMTVPVYAACPRPERSSSLTDFAGIAAVAPKDRHHMNTDLFEIIRTTRSMRRLKPDPVPPAMIRQVLEAGTAAANGGKMQTWRFLVVRDPAIKENVAQWYRRGWHETVAPRYRASAPPPGSSRDRFDRLLAAAEHL